MMTAQTNWSNTAVFAATAVITAGVLYFLFGSKKNVSGKNPFSSDSREPAKPFEFDKASRDKVLKNGYSDKKLVATGGNFDVIVIGSGIGGLTTAALLSRAGKKVLLLEQHDQCGGCCHSFTEKGFEFDTGIFR
jgi:all-trans-retinol 13,14-reductase